MHSLNFKAYREASRQTNDNGAPHKSCKSGQYGVPRWVFELAVWPGSCDSGPEKWSLTLTGRVWGLGFRVQGLDNSCEPLIWGFQKIKEIKGSYDQGFSLAESIRETSSLKLPISSSWASLLTSTFGALADPYPSV